MTAGGTSMDLQVALFLRCVSSRRKALPHFGQGTFFALPFLFLAIVFADMRCW